MELVAKLVVVGLVAAALWWACQPRFVFLVRIKYGEQHVARGKVTRAFLQQVAEVCGAAGVKRGWVGGVQRGKHTTLLFSRSIPAPCRQQLRNRWALDG
jgi:hypothetical protein